MPAAIIAVLGPMVLQVGLWLLDKWFVKNPKDRDIFISFVNAMRARGMRDVAKRYLAESASTTVDQRWDQIKEKRDDIEKTN